MNELNSAQQESVNGGVDPLSIGIAVGAGIALWEWGKKKRWW